MTPKRPPGDCGDKAFLPSSSAAPPKPPLSPRPLSRQRRTSALFSGLVHVHCRHPGMSVIALTLEGALFARVSKDVLHILSSLEPPPPPQIPPPAPPPAFPFV